MGRVFGFIGNRPELGARILRKYSEHLIVSASVEEPVGWGIGFYQSGEVLLRRRPLDERSGVPIDSIVEKVQTDVLVGQVRQPTVGGLRTENTPPFRYRQWLFAHSGTIAGFDQLRERLLEPQPEFLRRNRRGDTDSELFFYLFLSFLHDAGHLQVPLTSAEQIRGALRATCAFIDQLSREAGHAANVGDVLLTNGEYLVALHRSGTLAERVVAGRTEVEGFLADDLPTSTRALSLEKARCTAVAGALVSLPPDWRRAPCPSLITMTRTEEPTAEML